MALSDSMKKTLYENLDYDKGGKLIASIFKAKTADIPILIVGLGGTGCEAAIRVKRMIKERFECGVDKNGEETDKPDNVEYLMIDTDLKTKNLISHDISLRKDEYLLITHSDVGSILKDRNNCLLPEANEWLTDKLPIETVVDGAGGVRQAGRLLLFLNANLIFDNIHAKIKRVTTRFSAQSTNVLVILMTGIGGGTGSGTFIDVSYIIRHLIEKEGRVARINGIIFMPDVSVAKSGVDKHAQSYIKSNGFAALKELDYLMNLEKNKGSFEQAYGGGNKVSSTSPIFEFCTLISSQDETGTPFKQPWDTTMKVASEMVVNLIANGNQSEGGFEVTSYMSNIKTLRNAFVSKLTNRAPVNYIYNAVGANRAILPVDDLLSYITYLMFQEMQGLFENVPDETDVKNMLKSLRLDEKLLKTTLENLAESKPDVGNLDYDMILNYNKCIEDVYTEMHANIKEWLKEEKNRFLAEFSEELEKKENSLYNAFFDLNKGPVYANRIILGNENPNMIEELRKIRQQVTVGKFNGVTIEQYKNMTKQAMEQLINKPLMKSKKKARNEYLNAYDVYFSALLHNEICDVEIGIYEQVIEKLKAFNHNIFENCVELIEILSKLFDKFGNIKTAGVHENKGGNAHFTWQLIEVPDMLKKLDADIKKNPEQGYKFKERIHTFLEMLIREHEEWFHNEETNIVTKVNRFLADQFEGMLAGSMDEFLGYKTSIEHTGVNEIKSLQNYYQEIFDHLYKESKTMFALKNTIYGLNYDFPVYSELSVPYNSVGAIAAAEEMANGSNQFQVKKSFLLNQIYQLNFKTGLPMYAYFFLDACEDEYELTKGEKGVHIYEKGINYRELPSPNFETTWVSGHMAKAEAARNKEYRAVFDKALAYGYITLDKQSQMYVCHYGETVPYEEMRKKAGIEKGISYVEAGAAKRYLRALKEELRRPGRLTKNIDIYNTRYLEDMITPDEQFAKNIFIQMFIPRMNIKNMVENHEAVLHEIQEMEQFTESDNDIAIFIRGLMSNYIFKRKQEYRYLDKDGISENLYLRTGKEDRFLLYPVFQAFYQLDRKIKDKMNECIMKKLNGCEDTEDLQMKKALDTLHEEARKDLDELKINWDEYKEGKEKITFFQNMLNSIETEEENLN